MAAGGSLRETEIKLPVESANQGRRLLREAGFRISRRRVHEQNVVFDTPGGALRSRGELLRLRRAGGRATLTFKGRATARKHKSRTEVETAVGNAESAQAILIALGLKPAFWYEKYRTEYSRKGSQGLATLDETPIGVFLELEGEPSWIDHCAKCLGFKQGSYITDSYGTLHRKLCAARGGDAARMSFSRSSPPGKSDLPGVETHLLNGQRACDIFGLGATRSSSTVP